MKSGADALEPIVLDLDISDLNAKMGDSVIADRSIRITGLGPRMAEFKQLKLYVAYLKYSNLTSCTLESQNHFVLNTFEHVLKHELHAETVSIKRN